jgi:hypothetical protein
METNMRNRLVNEFRDLIDKGYTDFEIHTVDDGFLINPTKIFKEKKSEGCGRYFFGDKITSGFVCNLIEGLCPSCKKEGEKE